jgi:hypothetical protein
VSLACRTKGVTDATEANIDGRDCPLDSRGPRWLGAGSDGHKTSAAACNAGLAHRERLVEVTPPRANEVVKGPFIALHVLARGHTLDDYYAGMPVLTCVGHDNEILDGRLVDMTSLQGPNVDQISMVGVTRGTHLLTLIPPRNDHSMVMSKAVMIPFYYRGPFRPEPAGYSGTSKPSVMITSPRPGSSVGGVSFTTRVRLHIFVDCQECFAKGLVRREGHRHVFRDKLTMPHMPQMSGINTATVSLNGVKPPRHRSPPGWLAGSQRARRSARGRTGAQPRYLAARVSMCS